MIIDDDTTEFKVFNSEEEIEEFRGLFHGMRKGLNEGDRLRGRAS